MVFKQMKGKPMDEWVQEYAEAHQNRFNQICHSFGIPMIVVSLVLMLVGCLGLLPSLFLWVGASLFVVGWVLQFVGHAVEGKPPEFLRDWRFLFVGLRWWVKKTTRRSLSTPNRSGLPDHPAINFESLVPDRKWLIGRGTEVRNVNKRQKSGPEMEAACRGVNIAVGEKPRELKGPRSLLRWFPSRLANLANPKGRKGLPIQEHCHPCHPIEHSRHCCCPLRSSR